MTVRPRDPELTVHLQPRQRPVEARRVVRRLPWMDDRHETRFGSALGVQPRMPSLEGGDDFLQEGQVR